MKSFMICTPSLSLNEMPATSSNATTSQIPTSPTFDLKRKHTANVHRGLDEIRHAIHQLVAKRDARRDRFAEIVKRAMSERFEDADEAYKAVMKTGIGQRLAKQAVELIQKQGRLTIFSMVDAVTRLSGKIVNAGDRNAVDQQVGQLLALAV